MGWKHTHNLTPQSSPMICKVLVYRYRRGLSVTRPEIAHSPSDLQKAALRKYVPIQRSTRSRAVHLAVI